MEMHHKTLISVRIRVNELLDATFHDVDADFEQNTVSVTRRTFSLPSLQLLMLSIHFPNLRYYDSPADVSHIHTGACLDTITAAPSSEVLKVEWDSHKQYHVRDDSQGKKIFLDSVVGFAERNCLSSKTFTELSLLRIPFVDKELVQVLRVVPHITRLRIWEGGNSRYPDALTPSFAEQMTLSSELNDDTRGLVPKLRYLSLIFPSSYWVDYTNFVEMLRSRIGRLSFVYIRSDASFEKLSELAQEGLEIQTV
ncbi:hypothetical protein VNI00_009251 [Paramarasmius palmivorus]|uniref:Uncharacterized protein n=1 Tax=Paramarasmius palmivorus TaxID=297713 RepID=A0AAW0CR90_9AGAR